MSSKNLCKTVISAAFEKKADKLAAYELIDRSDICDYQVVCSANSTRQAQSVVDNVVKQCKQTLGCPALHMEGFDVGQWIVVDYGSVIVHVFINEVIKQDV